MKIYINAKSKKEVNESIAQNKTIIGTNFSIFGGGGDYSLTNCPDGTVIVIYDKMVGGNPYAKSYGTWNGKKII